MQIKRGKSHKSQLSEEKLKNSRSSERGKIFREIGEINLHCALSSNVVLVRIYVHMLLHRKPIR